MSTPFPEKMTDSNTEADIGLLLAIASQLFTTRVAAVVGRSGVTYTQFSMLNHLVVQPDSTISEIANAMEINQPGVSKVVQRLAEADLVQVVADPHDSRRRRVSATAAGRSRLADAQRLLEQDGAAWFADWPIAHRTEFRDHLATLVGWLDSNRLEPSDG